MYFACAPGERVGEADSRGTQPDIERPGPETVHEIVAPASDQSDLPLLLVEDADDGSEPRRSSPPRRGSPERCAFEKRLPDFRRARKPADGDPEVPG
jgi:hypothetical protein